MWNAFYEAHVLWDWEGSCDAACVSSVDLLRLLVLLRLLR